MAELAHMKGAKQVKRKLHKLEQRMRQQAAECQQHGYGTVHGLMWDKHCVQRETLRWVLGKPRKPFNAADTMAGW